MRYAPTGDAIDSSRVRHAMPRTGRWIAVAALSAVCACATNPTFMLGAGGSEFGTITGPNGTVYDITELSNDNIRVDVQGGEGNPVFTFDPDGNLTNITLDDGSMINFNHQSDGSIQVSGNGMFGGDQVSFSFTVPPNGSSSGKNKGFQAAAGDPIIVCLVIDLFCESLEDFIAEVVPVLIDELINANLPALIAEFNEQSFIPIPEGTITQFPTGIGPFDNFVRAQAAAQIEPYLAEVRNFCAHWQLLRLLEISACDALGS